MNSVGQACAELLAERAIMNGAEKKMRGEAFVAMRRRWFVTVFLGSFVVLLILVGWRYDSLVEILGFSILGALVVTTLVSLVSIPVVWRMSGKRRRGV